MGDVCLAPTRFASHFPFLSFSAVITFLVPAHGFWAGLDPSIALGMLRVLPYGPTAGPRHHGPKEQTPLCGTHPGCKPSSECSFVSQLAFPGEMGCRSHGMRSARIPVAGSPFPAEK